MIKNQICIYWHKAREFCNSPIVPKNCPNFEIDGRQCKTHGIIEPIIEDEINQSAEMELKNG